MPSSVGGEPHGGPEHRVLVKRQADHVEPRRWRRREAEDRGKLIRHISDLCGKEARNALCNPINLTVPPGPYIPRGKPDCGHGEFAC